VCDENEFLIIEIAKNNEIKKKRERNEMKCEMKILS
jgi:hypothetical protein